jgi:hypothetical protein
VLVRRGDWARAFAIRLAIAYVLLVMPWPGVEKGFSSLFRVTTNALFTAVGLGDYLELIVSASNHPRGDVVLASTKPTVGRLRMEFGSRDWAYLPLAAGLALIFAVPSPCPGRGRSGFLLMFLIVVFILLRIAVASVYGLGRVGVLSIDPGSLDALGSFMLGFAGTPVVSFAVPVILWLMVLYRSFDFGMLLRVDPAGDGPKAQSHSGAGDGPVKRR